MTFTSRARRLPLLACCALAACGGAKSSSSSNNTGTSGHDLSAAAPLVAVASPVASRSGGSTSQALRKRALTAETQSTTPQAKSLPDQIASIKARLAETTVDGCLAGIQFEAPQVFTSCYGPSLAYLNHPNYTGGPSGMAGGCNITSDGVGADGNDGCVPSGDLGMWTAKEPSGEACTAATMNGKVLSVSAMVHSAVDLMAGLICVANVNQSDLTAGGAAIDLHETVNSKLGTSLTTASLERLADQSDGRATYRIAVAGTVNGKSVSVTAVHSPGDDTGDGGAGLLNGYIDEVDQMFNVSFRRAFSVLYGKTDGTVRYEARSINTSTDVGPSELFTTSGVVDFVAQVGRPQGEGMGAGGTLDRAEIDASTGLGTLVHAWQAGNGDHFTRVFQATTSAGVNGGPDTGYGYFGFGPALDSAQIGSILGMSCNWAGPGSRPNGTPINTPNVQAQSMVRDATNGLFVPDVNHLRYAPTNSCNATQDDVDHGFVYEAFGSGPSDSPADADLQALQPMNPVSNGLVPQGFFGAIPDISAPAAYTIPAS